MVSLIVGIVTLPFLLLSWRRTGNDDDAALALGIIAWLLLSAVAWVALFGVPFV